MVPSEATVTPFEGLPKLLARMLVLPILIRCAKTHWPRLVHPIGLPLGSRGRPSDWHNPTSTYLSCERITLAPPELAPVVVLMPTPEPRSARICRLPGWVKSTPRE